MKSQIAIFLTLGESVMYTASGKQS